jgi:RimJ/RimL family protein N-acetyltransferase
VPGEILTTGRMRLEPWSASHTAMLVRLASLPEVTRFIGDGSPWPRAPAVELSARTAEHWRQHGFGWRAAIEVATGRDVGLMALNFAGPDAGIVADEYEIGWWLDPAAWGRGLAREGARAVRDDAFTRLRAPSVVARVQPRNSASLAVAASIGLIREGESRGRFGERFLVLRLTAADWPRASGRGASDSRLR